MTLGAVSQQHPSNVESWLNNLISQLQEEFQDGLHLAIPVGIFLDEVWITLNDTGTETDCATRIRYISLPWGLRECGFTSTNSLIWTYNFRENSAFNTNFSISSQALTEFDQLIRINQNLIDGSLLRVILLCGVNAVKAVGIQQFFLLKLELPTGNFNAWANIKGCCIEILYIYCLQTIRGLINTSIHCSS